MAERTHTGRRKGGSGTRALIEAAARRQFSELGYERTSLRQVAQEAGVDPALVSHFYGTKQQLFLRVVQMPFVPDDVVVIIVTGAPEQAGLRLARFVVGLLEQEHTRILVLSLIRAALSEPEAVSLLRDVLTRQVLLPIAEHLDAGDAEFRASLVMSQIVGMILARYIVALEPLAMRAPGEIIAALAQTFQQYLTGDLTREHAG
jgi:AcrR family transcriptional regulator